MEAHVKPTALTAIHAPTLQLLLLNAALLIVPHVQTLNPAVIALALGLIIWRIVAIKKPRWLPPRSVLLVLTFIMAFAIVRAHGVSLGRDASSSLLLVLMGLKLLELRRDRDVLVAIYLGFFLLITPFLYDQTIPLAVYGLLMFLLLITNLVVHNIKPDRLNMRAIWQISGTLSLLALPLMMALFLLFPRIVGPLWALPDDASKAYSGISNTLNPGEISSLSLLDETAFRVTFESGVPAQKDLYWRGPVFWSSNGKEWFHQHRLATFQATPDTLQLPANATEYRYSIIMEPHQQRWLYALDQPLSAPEGAQLSDDGQLILRNKLNRTRQYQLTSSPQIQTTNLTGHERFKALLLPDEMDPRVTELANQWRQSQNSDAEVVHASLRYFREQPYIYTLKPPLLGNNPVGEFLFETRRGFCAHYATSFAILMRSAGIPARVVAGYHGGVWNEMGGFLEIRQADAHVWNEVWLDGRGWVRVDPTAAISPNRIEHSIDLQSQLGDGEVLFMLNPPEGFTRWLLNIDQFWMTMDYYWQAAILAYGPEVQRDFLGRFGLDNWQDMVKSLGGLALVILILTAWFVLRQKPVDTDPVQQLFLQFCRRLSKQTEPRQPHETASDYLQKIAQQKPDQRQQLQQIRSAYLRARYANGDPDQVKELIDGYFSGRAAH